MPLAVPPICPVSCIGQVSRGKETDRAHPAFPIGFGENRFVLPGVQALPELWALLRFYAPAATLDHAPQPVRSLMFRFLNGVDPERKGFPFNILFPVFQKSRPRDLPSLPFGLAPGFTLNSPLERIKRTNSALSPHGLLEANLA